MTAPLQTNKFSSDPGGLVIHSMDLFIRMSSLIVSDLTLMILAHDGSSPFHYANPNLDGGKTVDYNITSISYVTARIPNDKPLRSITLPSDSSFINFFAISLVGVASNSTGPVLSVENVRSTTKWFDSDEAGSKIQRIEVTLANLSPLSAPFNASWITSPHNVTLSSSNNEIVTVIPGNVLRLRSNDQVVIPVGIRSAQTLSVGSKVKVKVQIHSESSLVSFENQEAEFEITAGIPEWKDSDDSLRTHESPDWVSAGPAHQ